MKKILLSLLVVAVVVGGWFLWKRRGAAEEEKAEKPAAKVEVVPLKRQVIAQTLEAFGIVAAAPSGEQTVSATYESVVRAVTASAGASVNVGDVLVEIDPSPETKLAFGSARSAIALATKALAATQQRYELKLATNQDLLAAQQVEQDARLKVASLEARGAGGDGKITATIAGIVSKLDVTAGALVPAGTLLVSVTSAEKLEVRLGIEAADLEQVTEGETVTLLSIARPEVESVSSTVRVVGKSLDPLTGAAELRVPVPASGELMLGEHVKASIELQKKETLVAPRIAVLPDDEKQILFTVKDGKAVKHEVKTGITSDDLVEVLSQELHEGDLVVALGNYELEDGMAIQPAEKAEKPGDAKDENKPGTKEALKAGKAPEAKP
jgi:membrane fusion protein (multidrug efflux system)